MTSSTSLPRNAALGLLLLLALVAAVGAASVRDVWTIDPDAAAYVTLGRHLAAGEGYHLDGVPHGKYPPGLPLLLAGLIRVSGPEAYGLFHMALVGALMAAVAGGFVLARQWGASDRAALALAAALALSETLADLSLRYLRTEVLFLALSIWAVIALHRALSREGGWGLVALATLLIVASTATRLAGVTLLAIPAWHLLNPAGGAAGRRRAAVLVAVGALALGVWMARGRAIVAAHPEAPDYGAELVAAAPRDLTKNVPLDMPTIDAAGLVERVQGNLEVFARACAVLLTNADEAGSQLPVGALLGALVLVGLAALIFGRRSEPDAPLDADAVRRRDGALYVLATLALYLVWPFDQQERFYAPLLPWLLLAAGSGLVLAHGVARRASASAAGRWLVILALTAITAWLASRTSADPAVLGRWSRKLAALVALGGVTTLVVAWVLLRRRGLPGLAPALVLALPLLFAPFWARFVLRDWPAQREAFTARRSAEPIAGPLARIDVNPILEQLARVLTDDTPGDAVVMNDVPKMMAVMSGRRCVPFTYRSEPPEVVPGDASYVFYTGQRPEIAAVMSACAGRFDIVLELAPLDVGDGRVLTPTLYRVRR